MWADYSCCDIVITYFTDVSSDKKFFSLTNYTKVVIAGNLLWYERNKTLQEL